MTRNPLDISQLIVNRAVEKPTKRRKISKQPTEEKTPSPTPSVFTTWHLISSNSSNPSLERNSKTEVARGSILK